MFSSMMKACRNSKLHRVLFLSWTLLTDRMHAAHSFIALTKEDGIFSTFPVNHDRSESMTNSVSTQNSDTGMKPVIGQVPRLRPSDPARTRRDALLRPIAIVQLDGRRLAGADQDKIPPSGFGVYRCDEGQPWNWRTVMPCPL